MLEHISVSQLKRFCECPLQYKFAWIDRIKRPIKSSLVVGKSFHKSYECNFKNKLQTHEDLKVTDLTDIYATTFEEQVQKEEIEDKAELPASKDTGVAGVKEYYIQAKMIQPEYVEAKFEIDVKPKIIGYIDLTDTQNNIIDYKFSSKMGQADKMKYDLQRLTYGVAYWHLAGKMPNEFYFDYVRALKSGIKCDRLSTGTITKEDANFLSNQIGRIVKAMEYAFQSGNFFPNTMSMACSWCGYSDLCKGGKW